MTIYINEQHTPIDEALALMTDEWIDAGLDCRQTVFDLRDALRKARSAGPILQELYTHSKRSCHTEKLAGKVLRLLGFTPSK